MKNRSEEIHSLDFYLNDCEYLLNENREKIKLNMNEHAMFHKALQRRKPGFLKDALDELIARHRFEDLDD